MIEINEESALVAVGFVGGRWRLQSHELGAWSSAGCRLRVILVRPSACLQRCHVVGGHHPVGPCALNQAVHPALVYGEAV